MSWIIAIGLVLGLLILLSLLFRLRIRLAFDYPFQLSFTGTLSFLWLRRAFRFPKLPGKESGPREGPIALGSYSQASVQSQGGFLHAPAFINRIRKNFKKSLFKCFTDMRVLRALARFGMTVATYFGKLPAIRITKFNLGHRDPLFLGKCAALLSIVVVVIPLRIPVQYHFNHEGTTLRLELVGGFSFLKLVAMLFRSLLAFPWFLLLNRFLASIRNSNLSGWQQRIYRKWLVTAH